MKRLLSVMLTVIMIFSAFMCVNVSAADEIKITINGSEKTFDVMPVIVNDRTLVPMRGIFEELGANITWDGNTKSVTANVASSTIVLQVGKVTALVNGQYVNLDAPARIINDRTMVPVRFIAETLGCTVDWAESTRTVVISGEVKPAPSAPQGGNEGSAPQGGGIVPVDDGWADIAVVGFEGGSAAPSSGLNFWGTKAEGGNANEKQVFVTYAEAGISKPSNTEDFGSGLLKLDENAGKQGPSTNGIVMGRINDIPASAVPYKAGEKYKMSVWMYLAEGDSAKVTMTAYVDKNTNGFKKETTAELKKGQWQRLELEVEATGEHEGKTTGARFSFEGAPSVIYMDNLSYEKPGSGVASTPAPAPSAPATPSTPSQTVADAKLPAGGKVIATLEDFATCVNNKTIKNKDGVIELNATKAESDNKTVATVTKALGDNIKEGNVYMLTFKARVVSGDPYLKGFIQGGKESNYAKAVFAATSYGKEWTTCYMPFVGPKAKMDGGWGFRLAGATHVTEIKDLQIIDYGTSVKITDLPHTYIVVGNTAVNGIKLQ